VVQIHRYLVFDATTSLGWDTGRAITDLICIVVLGPGLLPMLRRAARRANFEAPVAFERGPLAESDKINQLT
jgi:energy-coupling factor transport system substrate-specific component